MKKKGFGIIIGIDEAGRGPLAGPVVAAAVFLKTRKFKNSIKDSKKLSPDLREKAFHEIYKKAYVGVGIMSEAVIDSQDILKATFHAMTHAVIRLLHHLPRDIKNQKNFDKSACLLVDGNHFQSELPYAFETIIKGDEKILSIACASIVAKVIRDRMLLIYDQIFPQYGFSQHKGYPTRAHRQAINAHGCCVIHRKTFSLGNTDSLLS